MNDLTVPFPDGFDSCGGCGYPYRHLTEAEASDALRWATERAAEGRGVDALVSLSWITEIMNRGPSLCVCAKADRLSGVPDDGFHVYRLYDKTDRLLYIGMSRRLRSRLRKHYADRPYVDRHEYEALPDEASMVAREASLIAEHNPPLNSQGNG